MPIIALPRTEAAAAGPAAAATPAADRRPGKRWSSLAIFAVAGLLLAVIIPGLLLSSFPDEGRSKAWLLTSAIMVYAGLRLSYRIADGVPRLFDFVLWLFTYVFMGIAPTIQIRTAELPSTTPGIDPVLDTRAAVAVIVGLAAYEIGHALARERRPAPAGSALRDAIDPGRAGLLAAVGLVAATYYVTTVGVATLFMNRYDAFDVKNAVMPDLALRSIITAAATYPLFIAAAAFIRLRAGTPRGPRRDRYLLMALVLIPALMLMSNPISNARYEFGTVGFALLVLAGTAETIPRARALMATIIAGLLLVFPLADAFRTKNSGFSRSGFFGEYVANPDYDAFWQVANTLSYLNDEGLRILRQASGVVLFWVPRSIWPDKPFDTGILLAQYRGYSFDNLSAPLWSELLINGSWVLLVGGFLAIGFLLRRLDTRTSFALLNKGQVWYIAGAVFPFYMVILLRGSLLQATGGLVVAIASLVWVRAGRQDPPDLWTATRHIPDRVR